MLINVLGTIYLTITICTVNEPIVCEDKQFKNPEATLHSCVMQGLISGQKILKRKGKEWTIKKWRCSGGPPQLGI